MADERRSGYCQQCKAQVVVFRKGTNHLLHLVLTIVTCLLWLIVWALDSVKFGGWRCSQCGSTNVSNVH